jgi:hypothetical protein
MSGNKESVISEKTLGIGFGCTVVTSYSPVINSADYATFDAFMEKLQATWDAEWAATMNADPAGGRVTAAGRVRRRWLDDSACACFSRLVSCKHTLTI